MSGTVNHPQGFPKLLANSYVQVGSNGLAHALLNPASAKMQLQGGQVAVSCDTAYPFSDVLNYNIKADAAMDFYVRVPAWTSSESSIQVGSKARSLSPDPKTGLHKTTLQKGSTRITYHLPSAIRTDSRANETVAIYKGAVLYALEISNHNTSTLPKPYYNPGFGLEYYNATDIPEQSRDWSYFSTSAWNYAIDSSTLAYHGPDSSSSTTALTNPLFAPGAPPGFMTAQACEIDWPMAPDGSVPGYPPIGDKKKCIKDSVEVKLVPYASAKTHMAELPVINLNLSSR